VDAGAISARAKPAAAAEKAKELQGMLQQRGCKEEFVPDPDLLLNGQVGLCMHEMCMHACMFGWERVGGGMGIRGWVWWRWRGGVRWRILHRVGLSCCKEVFVPGPGLLFNGQVGLT
jgi:hypothetical protein